MIAQLETQLEMLQMKQAEQRSNYEIRRAALEGQIKDNREKQKFGKMSPLKSEIKALHSEHTAMAQEVGNSISMMKSEIRDLIVKFSKHETGVSKNASIYHRGRDGQKICAQVTFERGITKHLRLVNNRWVGTPTGIHSKTLKSDVLVDYSDQVPRNLRNFVQLNHRVENATTGDTHEPLARL